jgi:hypothetical protein
MLESIRDQWHSIVVDVANRLPIIHAEKRNDGTLRLIPSDEFSLVLVTLNPHVSPVADVDGNFAKDIFLDELVLMIKGVNNIPKIQSAIFVEIVSIKVLPQIIPGLKRTHLLHVVPVDLSERVADSLNLVLGPEMDSPLRVGAFDRLEGTSAVLGREDGLRLRFWHGVETDREVILYIGLYHTL